MASLNYNKRINNVYFDFLVEGFYTQLNDPFSNEFSDPDENGTVVYTRVNAEKGASVKGVNLELNVVPSDKFSLKAGFTVQSSEYEEAQEFDEKRFFRTPDNYGFMTLDWQTTNKLGFSFTSNYTGKMLVPYFGMQLPNPDEGELRETETFMDLGVKGRYNIKLNGATLQLFAGVKNILNSYQDNFDRGIDRDPGYVYGPMNPRTVYVGINIGNFLK